MLVRAKRDHGNAPDSAAGFMFNRQIQPGEIFEIPDDVIDEKDETIVLQVGVRSGAANPKTYTEFQRRKAILASNHFRGIKKEHAELYLKLKHFSPQWMEPAPKGAAATLNKETTEPESDITKLGPQDAISLINKCYDTGTIEEWIDKEKAGEKRDNVLATLKAQLRTASKK